MFKCSILKWRETTNSFSLLRFKITRFVPSFLFRRKMPDRKDRPEGLAVSMTSMQRRFDTSFRKASSSPFGAICDPDPNPCLGSSHSSMGIPSIISSTYLSCVISSHFLRQSGSLPALYVFCVLYCFVCEVQPLSLQSQT